MIRLKASGEASRRERRGETLSLALLGIAFLLPPAMRLVTRLRLRVGRIEARQRRAVLDLLHDPRFELLLPETPPNPLVDHSVWNHDRPVAVHNDDIIGEHRHTPTADRLLPVHEGEA